MKDDRLYLIHVLECIERIETYTHENIENFVKDIKTQDAVLRNLHTLTESAQHISKKLKSQYPHVEWREISGFRNVVVHDYLGVDIEQVLRIIEKDLPSLKEKIKIIIDEMS